MIYNYKRKSTKKASRLIKQQMISYNDVKFAICINFFLKASWSGHFFILQAMSCYRRRNIQKAKILGANKYTSCFNFDQSVEEHEFDDHLLNQAPIVQISNVLQRYPYRITTRPTFPDLQCVKIQSMPQQSRLSFKQFSTEQPFDSCQNFQKYQRLNLRQNQFFSTQIGPVHSKTTFRCHSLRKYSVELQNFSEIPDLSAKTLKTEVKHPHRRTTSLTKRPSLPNNQETTSNYRKKYSQRSLNKGITKLNSKDSKYSDISPWKLKTQESLF